MADLHGYLHVLKHCIVTIANEHQMFVPGGLVFNGLWAQLADLQEQISLIAGAGVVLLSCYFEKTWVGAYKGKGV